MSKKITVIEYADIAEVTTAAISYRVTRNKNLPGIKSYTYNEATRQYELIRDERIKPEEIKNYFRNK